MPSPLPTHRSDRVCTFCAYTLIELLVALTLSLFLLLAVAELFQRLGGTMNETRAAMSVSSSLHSTAIMLRQDLTRIPPTLSKKPQRIADGEEVSDRDGFLEIIEGPNNLSSHPYIDERGNPDTTVGDIDDIICFTAKTNAQMPFRGLINGEISERDLAEITWFVRGNTLYRRVRLLDDLAIRAKNRTEKVGPFLTKTDLDAVTPEEGEYAIVQSDFDGEPRRYDAIPNEDGWEWRALNTMEDLAHRSRRFGHDGLIRNTFPFPIYEKEHPGWYYLRMPLLEEELSAGWWGEQWRDKSNAMLDLVQPEDSLDLWSQPHFYPPPLQDKKSGALQVATYHPRAGEDVVLTNVLSFDVKVWDSSAEQFVDLGTSGNWSGEGNQPDLPHVWDSWTREYKKADGVTVEPPPYEKSIESLQIVIRCFDPASQIIKQITTVHRFRD